MLAGAEDGPGRGEWTGQLALGETSKSLRDSALSRNVALLRREHTGLPLSRLAFWAFPHCQHAAPCSLTHRAWRR